MTGPPAEVELELPEVLEVTDAEAVSELGGLAAEVTRLDELWPGVDAPTPPPGGAQGRFAAAIPPTTIAPTAAAEPSASSHDRRGATGAVARDRISANRSPGVIEAASRESAASSGVVLRSGGGYLGRQLRA